MQRKIKEIQAEGRIPLLKNHVHYILSTSVIHSQFPSLVNDVHPAILDETLESTPNVNTRMGTASNPTFLPDPFLVNITPLFTIRHPTSVVSSIAKAMINSLGAGPNDPGIRLASTLRWPRILFDLFKESGREAIVIDGDELVNDTQNQMRKLCALIGVDESRIQYEWAPKASHTPMDVEHNEQIYLKTIYESTGVIKDKGKVEPPALEDEVRRWTVEYGEDIALKLKGYVEEAMDDYNYLSQFRIR
ncbi:hypothetical protein L218DRAFT_906236 [Marasmius fiardii PR-910]|nr:hypothetical protein L218DRAFT_906236 [Marasmius fiardii PR-910]